MATFCVRFSLAVPLPSSFPIHLPSVVTSVCLLEHSDPVTREGEDAFGGPRSRESIRCDADGRTEVLPRCDENPI
jgi:hypothetical protein